MSGLGEDRFGHHADNLCVGKHIDDQASTQLSVGKAW
jgi:hypothetical protein